MPIQGRCALCDTFGNLCESHVYLPKFLFKRLRTPSAKNPNPVVVSVRGVVQSSAQKKQPLLCGVCENDRFNKLGENWVAGACLQDNNMTFPLMQSLQEAGVPRHDIMEGASAFYAARAPDVRCECLEYFAASMVWRGQFLLGKRYTLGPYDQQFRDYLLQKSPFPEDVSLHLYVRYRSNITQLSHGVRRKRHNLITIYNFAIPGLTFQILVGKEREDWIKQCCFHANGFRPIMEFEAMDRLMHDQLVRLTAKAGAEGRRSRLFPRGDR
jgi:hypothetical protein